MQPRNILIFCTLFSLFSSSAFAGNWKKIDAHTLSFKGEIEPDEYKKFSTLFSPEITELRVDSKGGETGAGIKMGFALLDHPVKIVVEGYCVSSCANYLFLGASERVIGPKGSVGFHGNVTCSFGGENREEYLQELRESGMTKKQIQENVVETDHQMADEARFLDIVGVSQKFFDITCLIDKGVGDGREYSALFPLKKTMEKHGIKNITGEQFTKELRKRKDVAIY